MLFDFHFLELVWRIRSIRAFRPLHHAIMNFYKIIAQISSRRQLLRPDQYKIIYAPIDFTRTEPKCSKNFLPNRRLTFSGLIIIQTILNLMPWKISVFYSMIYTKMNKQISNLSPVIVSSCHPINGPLFSPRLIQPITAGIFFPKQILTSKSVFSSDIIRGDYQMGCSWDPKYRA